jgi:hypothetical protein
VSTPSRSTPEAVRRDLGPSYRDVVVADPDRAEADGLKVTLPLSIGLVAVRVGSRGEERHA